MPTKLSPRTPTAIAPAIEMSKINGASHFKVAAVHTGLLVAKQDSPPLVRHSPTSDENPFESARKNI